MKNVWYCKKLQFCFGNYIESNRCNAVVVIIVHEMLCLDLACLCLQFNKFHSFFYILYLQNMQTITLVGLHTQN